MNVFEYAKNLLCVIVWDYASILVFMRDSTDLCFFRGTYALSFGFMRHLHRLCVFNIRSKRFFQRSRV